MNLFDDTVARLLNCGMEQLRITEAKNSAGPGNVVMVEVESESVLEIFTSFGKVGCECGESGLCSCCTGPSLSRI
jgi:hypothetical protein